MRRKEKGGTDLMDFCLQSARARGTENVIFRYQGGKRDGCGKVVCNLWISAPQAGEVSGGIR